MKMMCPHCGVKGTAGDELLNKKVKCPKCSGFFVAGAEVLDAIEIDDSELEQLLDEEGVIGDGHNSKDVSSGQIKPDDILSENEIDRLLSGRMDTDNDELIAALSDETWDDEKSPSSVFDDDLLVLEEPENNRLIGHAGDDELLQLGEKIQLLDVDQEEVIILDEEELNSSDLDEELEISEEDMFLGGSNDFSVTDTVEDDEAAIAFADDLIYEGEDALIYGDDDQEELLNADGGEAGDSIDDLLDDLLPAGASLDEEEVEADEWFVEGQNQEKDIVAAESDDLLVLEDAPVAESDDLLVLEDAALAGGKEERVTSFFDDDKSYVEDEKEPLAPYVPLDYGMEDLWRSTNDRETDLDSKMMEACTSCGSPLEPGAGYKLGSSLYCERCIPGKKGGSQRDDIELSAVGAGGSSAGKKKKISGVFKGLFSKK